MTDKFAGEPPRIVKPFDPRHRLSRGRAKAEREAKAERARIHAEVEAERAARPHNREVHGLETARAALRRFGERAIPEVIAMRLAEWRRDVIEGLGGEENLSESQRTLVDVAGRTKLLLDSVDGYLLGLDNIVNKRHRTLYPVVTQRAALAASLLGTLSALGLERRAPPEKSLAQYLAERAAAREAEACVTGDTVVTGDTEEASP